MKTSSTHSSVNFSLSHALSSPYSRHPSLRVRACEMSYALASRADGAFNNTVVDTIRNSTSSAQQYLEDAIACLVESTMQDPPQRPEVTLVRARPGTNTSIDEDTGRTTTERRKTSTRYVYTLGSEAQDLRYGRNRSRGGCESSMLSSVVQIIRLMSDMLITMKSGVTVTKRCVHDF